MAETDEEIPAVFLRHDHALIITRRLPAAFTGRDREDTFTAAAFCVCGEWRWDVKRDPDPQATFAAFAAEHQDQVAADRES